MTGTAATPQGDNVWPHQTKAAPQRWPAPAADMTRESRPRDGWAFVAMLMAIVGLVTVTALVTIGTLARTAPTAPTTTTTTTTTTTEPEGSWWLELHRAGDP
jgi:hypothetical protein